MFGFIFSACGTSLRQSTNPANYNKGMSRVSPMEQERSRRILLPRDRYRDPCKLSPKIRNAGGSGVLMLFKLFECKCLSVVLGPPGMFSELRRDNNRILIRVFISYMIMWDEWGKLPVCDLEFAYGRRMTSVPDHRLEKTCLNAMSAGAVCQLHLVILLLTS
jgi:hypothetical protein